MRWILCVFGSMEINFMFLAKKNFDIRILNGVAASIFVTVTILLRCNLNDLLITIAPAQKIRNAGLPAALPEQAVCPKVLGAVLSNDG
jgi:hypothetical protein